VKISDSIAATFDRVSRERGREYYLQGRVRLVDHDDSTVVADVRGTETYRVLLETTTKGLRAACECPRFEDTGNCKHIWATILAAENRGWLNGWSVTQRLELLPAEKEGFQLEPPPLPAPRWRGQLADLRRSSVERTPSWSSNRQVVYHLEPSHNPRPGSLAIRLHYRDQKQNGSWSKPKTFRLTRSLLDVIADPFDREMLIALAGSSLASDYFTPLSEYGAQDTLVHLLPAAAESYIPRLCNAGRAFLNRSGKEGPMPLAWDQGAPWEFSIEMTKERHRWVVRGFFHRGEQRMAVTEPILIVEGLIFTFGHVASLAANAGDRWLDFLRKGGIIEAFPGQQEDLLAEILADPRAPSVTVPEELQFERIMGQPRPIFRIRQTPHSESLVGEVIFDYNGAKVGETDDSTPLYDRDRRLLLVRNREREAEYSRFIANAGLRQAPTFLGPGALWEVPATRLPKIVRALIPEGWDVEAEGRLIRRPGASSLSVTSGIDWFELHASVDYGGVQATLPQLLKALRRGDTMVRLSDGSYGMLPEEWLRKLGAIPNYGEETGDHIRFRRTQTGLLDALLAAQPEIEFDKAFATARQELTGFQSVERAEQPPGFVGVLRGYQLDGLGWMYFLQRFGFGGCLADDMGVGKTPQVLALLETRRARREAGELIPPSLVIVPRSLVFNWFQEAARFTPRLRLLDHTGAGRSTETFDGVDVILTTYGTLRRDVVDFKDIRFDYVILDEAQAIKNASTESAKAARLLQSDHRLALSGTPVENHLGELWSLFEFLNPGLLGGAAALREASAATRGMDDDARQVLARALRPFILRRTKDQVASELPPKIEQTLVCELEPKQRQLYDELREHYRSSLLNKLTDAGLKKSKIQVLEALLRLRQAACHPGLIDETRREESSAKLDLLEIQLDEILQEGSKAIIFSQFTSFLAILRARLDAGKIPYEYLDGGTRDRESCVNRFQNDPDCKLFLISLKAGGLGLNLTAAEYVFLLDPWWNPAVESQAIDRAHRIGQQRQVFAYRLIAKDTVEEKILELQKTKRDLADAIITADNSIIGSLGREELEMLLS
jgi:superfamily II DNA or RNA helicase